MKNILRPDSVIAKWLVALFIIAIFMIGHLNYLDGIEEFLDSPAYTFKLGKKFDLSVYELLEGAFVVVALFWLASTVSAFVERVVRSISSIRASNRSLIVKGFQIFVYIAVFLLALKILGVDVTTFAVFSGAIGIGIGFGLQKITSNFISGIILLFEKSVESGDWIELDDKTQGIVKRIWARHTLIETFDRKEIMIPNEDFITSRVINWTHSSKDARMKIEIGVSYESDIEKARELLLESAAEHKLVSKKIAPQCYLINYGDSSVDFVLYFWIDDVVEHYWGPRSDIMRIIWEKFKANNIVIPYPQRDVHIKNLEDLKS